MVAAWRVGQHDKETIWFRNQVSRRMIVTCAESARRFNASRGRSQPQRNCIDRGSSTISSSLSDSGLRVIAANDFGGCGGAGRWVGRRKRLKGPAMAFPGDRSAEPAHHSLVRPGRRRISA